jgi:hypothetical protein
MARSAPAEFAHEQFAPIEIARQEEARLETLEDRIDADLAAASEGRALSGRSRNSSGASVAQTRHGQPMPAPSTPGRK